MSQSTETVKKGIGSILITPNDTTKLPYNLTCNDIRLKVDTPSKTGTWTCYDQRPTWDRFILPTEPSVISSRECTYVGNINNKSVVLSGSSPSDGQGTTCNTLNYKIEIII
jgi:hypothetical protein